MEMSFEISSLTENLNEYISNNTSKYSLYFVQAGQAPTAPERTGGKNPNI